MARIKIKGITLSRQILIIAIVCSSWILLYKFIFLKQTELFRGAYELGDVFYTLNSSIIASAIFYYIVVYRPIKQKHGVIKEIITARIDRFNLDYMFIKKDLYNLKGLDVPEDIPENHQDFILVCEGILLTEKPPIIFNNLSFIPDNWFDYFDYYFELENSNIRFLGNYWEDVPVEVKVLIEKLQTNTLHSGLRLYKTTGYSDKLSDLAGPLWNHLNILKQLPITFLQRMRL